MSLVLNFSPAYDNVFADLSAIAWYSQLWFLPADFVLLPVIQHIIKKDFLWMHPTPSGIHNRVLRPSMDAPDQHCWWAPCLLKEGSSWNRRGACRRWPPKFTSSWPAWLDSPPRELLVLRLKLQHSQPLIALICSQDKHLYGSSKRRGSKVGNGSLGG